MTCSLVWHAEGMPVSPLRDSTSREKITVTVRGTVVPHLDPPAVRDYRTHIIYQMVQDGVGRKHDRRQRQLVWICAAMPPAPVALPEGGLHPGAALPVAKPRGIGAWRYGRGVARERGESSPLIQIHVEPIENEGAGTTGCYRPKRFARIAAAIREAEK